MEAKRFTYLFAIKLYLHISFMEISVLDCIPMSTKANLKARNPCSFTSTQVQAKHIYKSHSKIDSLGKGSEGIFTSDWKLGQGQLFSIIFN